MFQLEPQLERLVQFRQSLGFNKSKMAEQLGLKQRAYAFYEAGDRSIPVEMLSGLAALGMNLHWFSTGEGSMLVNTGRAAVVEEDDVSSAYGTVGSDHEGVTPGFPEKEIVRATELAYKVLGAYTATPSKMGWIVATIAEMLVRGRAEEEILEAVRPMAKMLAGSSSQQPEYHAPKSSEPRKPGP